MNAFVSIAPIVILIILMTKRKSVPSHVALPAVAVLVYALKLIYFEADPNLVNAVVVDGLLSAWTPILIIGGAILMFKTMEASGNMDTLREWLNGISDNPVAQLMIIGWAFTFLIEGASGFGTPAALAAPILVGLGFDPLRIAILCLIMNSVPVSFGAVGTPTWFGMGQLSLDEAQLLTISRYSALMHACAALLIPAIALRFVISWSDLRRNLGFVYLSVASCVVPYVALAHFNYEFPALLGGMIGLVVSILLARHGVGLASSTPGEPSARPVVSWGRLARASFPLWGTVLVLLVTRIPQLGVRGLLIDASPIIDAQLGTLGRLSVSRSLVLSLSSIYGADSHWSFQTLYVPALIPFGLVSLLAFVLFGLRGEMVRGLFQDTCRRMTHASVALLGALVFVKLLMTGGENAMVMQIGNFFAGTAGPHWQYFAAYLGASGAFFSGSATISNLTFSGIQSSIALQSGLDLPLILSLQSVGAAMGNMVSINNIVAVCSILGIAQREGFILKRTVMPMILYGVVAALVARMLMAMLG